jgi:hypothetical protein
VAKAEVEPGEASAVEFPFRAAPSDALIDKVTRVHELNRTGEGTDAGG